MGFIPKSSSVYRALPVLSCSLSVWRCSIFHTQMNHQALIRPLLKFEKQGCDVETVVIVRLCLWACWDKSWEATICVQFRTQIWFRNYALVLNGVIAM